MKELHEAAQFLSKARRRMRFGEFSREPLQLLRLEWRGDSVDCDWLMRAADPWDQDLPARVAEEHRTLQALRDALSLRDNIFDAFPRVNRAELRMFRSNGDHQAELLMTGSVLRNNEICPRVPSVAMRALLCGFRFTLAGGVLESMALPVSCS